MPILSWQENNNTASKSKKSCSIHRYRDRRMEDDISRTIEWESLIDESAIWSLFHKCVRSEGSPSEAFHGSLLRFEYSLMQALEAVW